MQKVRHATCTASLSRKPSKHDGIIPADKLTLNDALEQWLDAIVSAVKYV
jgi:hypothetical protein